MTERSTWYNEGTLLGLIRDERVVRDTCRSRNGGDAAQSLDDRVTGVCLQEETGAAGTQGFGASGWVIVRRDVDDGRTITLGEQSSMQGDA